MAERVEEINNLYEQALKNDEKLAELAGRLSGSSRRIRQVSGAAMALVAKETPERLVPHIAACVEALNLPEAQTRWECLDILTCVVEYDARSCEKAIPGAETALFDEESGPVRLAAMRFLCKFGATTAVRSDKVWSLIDEGIQCYHGDLEFNDMLTAITDFSMGKLSLTVKQELAARMAFDAENGKGSLKRRAAQIVANVS